MSREFNVEVALKQIKRTVNHFSNLTPSITRTHDREDLTQEIYCWFLEKKFFEKYDPSITSFEYFVAAAAKNKLIDFTRKRIIKTQSVDNTFIRNEKEGSEVALLDLIADACTVDPEILISLKDLIECIPDEIISPNYDLTWRRLLYLVLEDSKPAEISKEVLVIKRGGTRNLSEGRVSQLISILREMCIEAIKGFVKSRKGTLCSLICM